MSLNRHNPKRDLNELPIVRALEALGRKVYRLSGPGVPDLLVCRPSREHPIHIVETIDQALDAAQADDLCLLEVKQPGGRLTIAQRKFHREVTLSDT